MNRYVLTGVKGRLVDEVWAKTFDGARISFEKKYRGRFKIVNKKTGEFVRVVLWRI